ncbi:hypothetical protein ACFOSV_00650 [Algoriphagus namhaensis]|uniref:Uncharacterized protein n=1 Tax=Algoriphagus namhaensis TaxID=915353 RepID=A0ABV8ALV5_9BACT
MAMFWCATAFTQSKKDSTKTSITKKALEQGLDLISQSNRDTVLVQNSDEEFVQFSGKIIREIYVESIGFEKSIYGNEKPIVKKMGRIANSLHTNSREKTIRQNLFIKPNEKINPYKMGDNERFLRGLDFILDSRLIVTPVEGTDSVDVTVLTRDVFSIGFSAGGNLTSAPILRAYDANLDGRGQRLEFNLLFDADRRPRTGFGASYEKKSFLGSFVDLELFYTEINDGISFGIEKEYSYGLKLERKLMSPYTRLAGGGQWSSNWSRNVYSRPDSVFLDYKYNVADFWIGYNFGAKKAIQDRNRMFLAVRSFKGYLIDTPVQEDFYQERSFRDINGVLSEMTFYKRDFFKTQYVYGFGRTEDVPYGYSFSPSVGVIRQQGRQRGYTGIKFNYSKGYPSGSFYIVDFNSSSFYKNSKLEDALVFTTFRYFTPAFVLGRYRLRNEINFSFAKLFNTNTNQWLEINSTQIPGLRIRDYQAEERSTFRAGSQVFTPWSLIGFRIAMFGIFDMVRVRCNTCLATENIYTGISSGFRIRNENLIFGTMEFKVTYIPNDETGDSKFAFKFRQNLRIRSRNNFVNPPSFIRFNN